VPSLSSIFSLIPEIAYTDKMGEEITSITYGRNLDIITVIIIIIPSIYLILLCI
jgi:hypothetical protein